MSARITFYGGAGSVTGANFLLDAGELKMLVDCGTVAQERVCDTANFGDWGYDPATVQALVVTHAHADHIGRIPKLVRDGFRGTIHSTDATKDIAAVMFDDALSIMREEYERHGCEILYEKEDAERALTLWRGHRYHEPFAAGDVTVELSDAGHILGSALVRISRGGRSIIFTGDLGNSPEPLLNDTESAAGANYIVMESVYGDRLHEKRNERAARLKEAVEDIRRQSGTLLIPSFSLERTQVLLFELNKMVENGELPPTPIFLDSPLASRITPIFRHYAGLFNEAVSARIARDDDPFDFPGLTVVHNVNASRGIHAQPNPKVIIAGAGMVGGGRIRSHLLHYLGDRRATVLFVGYQAPGTLGRRIQDGAKKVQIDGQYVRVHARVQVLTGYSGHADRDQLLTFVESAGESLERVFVTMGEMKSSLFLGQRIHDFFGVDAVVPKRGETHTVDL